MVDVRDVANAHLQAILRPDAAGKRYILVEGSYWFHDMGDFLAEKYKGQYKVVTKRISKPMMWIASIFMSDAKVMYKLWGT